VTILLLPDSNSMTLKAPPTFLLASDLSMIPLSHPSPLGWILFL
jgi:hypothetical protein